MSTPVFPKLLSSTALDLHSPQRQLIELQIMHADLDSLIDQAVSVPAHQDELSLQRMKKSDWHCAIKLLCCSHVWCPRSLLELA